MRLRQATTFERLLHQGITNLAVVLIAAIGIIQSPADTVDNALQLVQTIPLPGVKGKFDHLAIDLAQHRVFLAAKTNNTLEVIDLNSGRRIRSVNGFNEPQGVLYLPDNKQVVVANGGTGEVDLLDDTSLNVVQRFPFGADADNISYDADARRIYVACRDGAVGAIDMNTASKLADIRLPAHPEALAIERNGQRLFVNVPKSNTVFVLDRSTGRIIATWKLTKAKRNYTMALDENHGRLFVGCREPARVLVLESKTGRETSTFPIGGETDGMFYDSTHQRIYITGAEGTLDVVEQTDTDHYRALTRLPTAPLARTCLFVPELDQLLVAVPQQKDRDAELRVYQAHH